MCRNIRTLFNFEPPATEEEIRASALQFMRKLSGFTHPSCANEAAFDRAVDEVTEAAHWLLDSLSTTSPAKNREAEAMKARERAKTHALNEFRLHPRFVRAISPGDGEARVFRCRALLRRRHVCAGGPRHGYLKADETTALDFKREGSGPFTYTRGKKSGGLSEHALSYWRLPDRLYDDSDELAIWAERALTIAQRQKFARRKRKRTTRKPKAKSVTKNSAGRRRSRA